MSVSLPRCNEERLLERCIRGFSTISRSTTWTLRWATVVEAARETPRWRLCFGPEIT